MDALARLLRGVHTEGALFDRSAMPGTWALRFEDAQPLAVALMLRGDAWVTIEGAPARYLPHGAVAVITHTDGYTVSGEPDAPPQAVVHGTVCTPLDRGVAETVELCSDRWDPAASTAVLLRATFGTRSLTGARILRALPAVLVVDPTPATTSIVAALADELARTRPGQTAILERLLDLLVVTTVREWLDRPEAAPPGWYRALGDPVVGPALELLHARPAEPWTVSSLARAVAVSRSTLARRFADLVGDSPMSYLARWRLDLAGELLCETDESIDAIARRVGYSNGYALSAACVRVFGRRPGELRATARGSARRRAG